MKEYGVLKAVRVSSEQQNMSDLIDSDIEIANVEVGGTEFFYIFTFVGVIVAFGRVMKCYPKYIFNCKEPKSHLHKVLKVLQKYMKIHNAKEQIVKAYDESNESGSFNLISVILFLLQDYYENGIYVNEKDVVELNGCGEIIWDKTINETVTMISDNRPYYLI